MTPARNQGEYCAKHVHPQRNYQSEEGNHEHGGDHHIKKVSNTTGEHWPVDEESGVGIWYFSFHRPITQVEIRPGAVCSTWTGASTPGVTGIRT